MLRTQNSHGSAEILKWAVDKNQIDVARQAYAKVSATVKWEMAKYLADRPQHHEETWMVSTPCEPVAQQSVPW